MEKDNSDIPKTMRAVVLEGHGGMDKLVYHEDWPTPIPGPKQVLVKVHACGMNNTDVNTRLGWYARDDNDGGGWDGGIKFPLIQGGDAVGTVVSVGSEVNDKVASNLMGKRCLFDTIMRDWDGDPTNMDKSRYLGSTSTDQGGFADYMTIDHRNAHPISDACGWSNAELATIAIAYTTAENMLVRANVTEKDTVLIPGASGGVGSALVQLSKLRGAKTIAMASESKHEVLASKLKPTAILPRQPANLKSAIEQAVDGEGGSVSVVADIVGGPQFSEMLSLLRRGGRYTCSGAIGGPIVELDLRTLYLNDLTLFGNTIYRPDVFSNLVQYIEQNHIVPLLAATYPLAQFHAGQSAFIEKKHIGNIVVTMD